MVLEKSGQDYIYKIRADKDHEVRTYTQEVFHIGTRSHLKLVYGKKFQKKNQHL